MDQKLWMACVIPFPRIPNRYRKINEVLSVSSSIKHPPHTRIFSKWQDWDFWTTTTTNSRYTVWQKQSYNTSMSSDSVGDGFYPVINGIAETSFLFLKTKGQKCWHWAVLETNNQTKQLGHGACLQTVEFNTHIHLITEWNPAKPSSSPAFLITILILTTITIILPSESYQEAFISS